MEKNTQQAWCNVVIHMWCLKSPFRKWSIPLHGEMVCIRYTMSGKQVHFECINDPCAYSIYMWMHLCVCMRMPMCVFVGVCLYLSVTVYTLSAWGHLDWVCVVLSGESAHMCLREDLVLCGCVFDKLWEHVGDCLSIHLGESRERERAEWGGGRDLLSASIFKSICSQSHKPLYLSLRQQGGRQAERDRLKNKYV